MPQNLDINRIVEKVLDQIAQGAREKKNAGTSYVTPNATARVAVNNNAGTSRRINPHAANGNGDELFIADRVIALGRIEKQLVGKKRLAITPGAILTPSVRDYLKDHRISICTATSSTASSDQKSVSVVAALTSYDPTEIVNRLTQQRFNVIASSSACLIETTDQLASQLTDPDRLGIILTRHHAATLCLANRHKSLRAVSVDHEDQIEPLVAAIGANVLIVSARGRSNFQLERILTRFLRTPNHTCPEVLRSRLA